MIAKRQWARGQGDVTAQSDRKKYELEARCTIAQDTQPDPVLSHAVECAPSRIRRIMHRYDTGHSRFAGPDQRQDLVKHRLEARVGYATVIFFDGFLIEPDIILEQVGYLVALCRGQRSFRGRASRVRNTICRVAPRNSQNPRATQKVAHQDGEFIKSLREAVKAELCEQIVQAFLRRGGAGRGKCASASVVEETVLRADCRVMFAAYSRNDMPFVTTSSCQGLWGIRRVKL